MASKRSKSTFDLNEAVAKIQQSDSESDFSNDEDSLGEDDDDTIIHDSNEEDNESPYESEGSSSIEDYDPPVRRRKVDSAVDMSVTPTQAQLLTGKNGYQWNSAAAPATQTAVANVLTQRKGLTAVGKGCKDICESFKCFVTMDMVLLIVKETNRRGKKAVREWNDVHQIADEQHVWNDTDEIEVLAFIGLLIQAGVQKSVVEGSDELWSAKYGRPVYRAAMSLTRFKELLRFCRFDNDVTRAERLTRDKLSPIRDLWEMFQAWLPLIYKPGSDITIDYCYLHR